MHYDYKVIPAPKQLKRVKGVKSTAELTATTLSEVINATARDGWEYLRAETLSAAEPGGMFRRPTEVVETVLIFRRPRETVSPRILASRPEAAAEPAFEPAAERERALPAPVLRREPRLAAEAETATQPLRPMPRLGPADNG